MGVHAYNKHECINKTQNDNRHHHKCWLVQVGWVMPILTLYGFTFIWYDEKWQATYDRRNIETTEAVSVFDNPNQITVIDNRFCYEELRMNTIGLSNKGRLLMVAWHEIDESTFKIITAYKPSHHQIKEYQHG